MAFEDDDADRLGSQGFVVLDGWLGDTHAHALHDEHLALLERGGFSESRVGHRSQRQHAPAIRSDRTCWFDDDDDAAHGPEVAHLLACLHGLRASLNASCFLSLTEIECHAACYEPGSAYDAHFDAFDDDDARVISFSHYLNAGWVDVDGGCLRMHDNNHETDIEPLFDRLVIFQSRSMRHEVRPVARRRFSTTGWMRARG
ncbi:MAG: 2OG-Fe(II) oxygenase [Deltaproteobacteria bacterium]|nr:2OG-Fe(II) oxygenase [Deltaproteobacteria bacterium]